MRNAVDVKKVHPLLAITYLPPEEYPSIDVPQGHYLARLDDLRDCYAAVCCTDVAVDMLDQRPWRRAPISTFNANGTSVLAFIITPQDQPGPLMDRVQRIFASDAVWDNDPVFITVPPGSEVLALPY